MTKKNGFRGRWKKACREKRDGKIFIMDRGRTSEKVKEIVAGKENN